MSASRIGVAFFSAELFSQLFERLLQLLMDGGGDQVRRPSLIIEAALECTVGTNQGIERFVDIGIHGAGGGERRLEELRAQED